MVDWKKYAPDPNLADDFARGSSKISERLKRELGEPTLKPSEITKKIDQLHNYLKKLPPEVKDVIRWQFIDWRDTRSSERVFTQGLNLLDQLAAITETPQVRHIHKRAQRNFRTVTHAWTIYTICGGPSKPDKRFKEYLTAFCYATGQWDEIDPPDVDGMIKKYRRSVFG